MMGRSAVPPRLTFEDAMSVHVLRAHGVIFSDLKRLFGVNTARFYEILCGVLFPGSWEAATERLTAQETWHPEIARLVGQHGFDHVLTALAGANPNKKHFEKELRRLRKSAPFKGAGSAQRPSASRSVGRRHTILR
jgi:hypothetical protein